MGRPLNKKYFGQPSSSGDEKLLSIAANINGTVGEAYIVRQKGAKKFVLSNGVEEQLCTLVDTLANPGEFVMNFDTVELSEALISKISAHRITMVTGETYAWKFNITPTTDYASFVTILP